MKESTVSIGLMNPKGTENVSSVMRSAGNFQAQNIFYTGTRYPRALKYQSRNVDMARKVSRDIPISGVTCLLAEVPEHMKIVCVELAENAVSLPSFQHPEHAFYIFGPEDGTVSQELIDKADAVVYVPTVGCMNLAATVNVVLYDRSAKAEQRIESNTLIRASRDRNNNVKVALSES